MRKSKIKNSTLAEEIANSVNKEAVVQEILEQVSTTAPAPLNHIRHYNNEQTSIIRQSSLKSAVTFMGILLPRLEIESADEVLAHTVAVAEEFERWVIRS
jgi:hypothetical protein